MKHGLATTFVFAVALVACGSRTRLREEDGGLVASDLPQLAPDAPADVAVEVIAPTDTPQAGCATPRTAMRRWSVVSVPTSDDLHDVFEVAPDDVWISGDNGLLLHYDGRAWQRVSHSAREDIGALWFASASDGWALTRSTVLRWDGDRWLLLAPLQVPAIQTLSVVWGTGPSDVWIGGGAASPQVQILAHFDGERFTLMGPEPLAIQVTGFAGTARDDVWAIGHLGRLAHLDGTRWSRIATPDEGTITACAPVARSRAWCVGLRGWVHEATPSGLRSTRIGSDETYYYAAWSAGNGELWTFGYEGAAARLVEGRWRPETIPTRATIQAIHGRCATDAWAVGDGGLVLRLTE